MKVAATVLSWAWTIVWLSWTANFILPGGAAPVSAGPGRAATAFPTAFPTAVGGPARSWWRPRPSASGHRVPGGAPHLFVP